MNSYDDTHQTHHLEQHMNITFVIASIGISFLGTYTATTLSEQYRVSCKMKNNLKSYLYLFAMAVSTGGVAIWSMHFVGMGSLVLEYRENGKEAVMTQNFDITLTILSLFLAISSVFLGIFIASHDSFYRKEPHEIFAFLVEKGTKKLSISNMQSSSALWALTLFTELQYLVFGGFITGFGVCLMHYVGMMSMTLNMAITWDTGIVAASVIIACLASIAANWILFRLLALYPRREYLRILSAVLMCIAVCGMHYTGMMAASYHQLHPSPAGSRHWNLPLVSKGYIGSHEAIFIALTFGISLSWILIMIALSDLRSWHYSLNQGLNESRKMVMSMSRASRFDEDRLLRQSVDLGAQYDRLNESKVPYRLRSRPPSVNIDSARPQSESETSPPQLSNQFAAMLKKKYDSVQELDQVIKKRDGPSMSPTNASQDGSSRSAIGIHDPLVQSHDLSLSSKRKSSRGKIYPVEGEEGVREEDPEEIV